MIKVINTKDRYWKAGGSKKFRQFKSQKGKKIPTQSYIERQKYRLDSPGEKRNIQRARGVKSFFGLK